ncbi:putative nuclease HARBI1 [Centruroides sculpturatus]|uniref:putative nuclease HARBI1 n=1 Tax=Centruroides sculpturatus TaxID=218467 RepID=UPI000C6C99F2|nr:putative nuclease HARBI1 [Centruroides sculpturatus]
MDIFNLINLTNRTNEEHHSSRQLRRERVMRGRNNPIEIYSEDELSKDNFPGIIGAIDCTHIPIQCPDSSKAQLFYNRKSYYSINCQVICDGKMKIRNIVARWPGSTHDSRIFCNSSIKEKLQGYCNGYLVGGSGYPCLPYLMTPFLHPQNHAERRYNKGHSRARNIVERLFGVWKRRFPRIGSCLRTKLDNTLNMIIATAILHNWAIEFKE